MLKVIAYAGRALQPAERSYCRTRKELLTVIYGLKHFRQFLLGRRFVFRTDHAALSSLFRTPEPDGQQARYLAPLGEYDMEIVNRSGASHKNSDALSHRPCEREAETTSRQCRSTGRERENRAVLVMTRHQLSTTTKLEEKIKRIPGCEVDLSPGAIR